MEGETFVGCQIPVIDGAGGERVTRPGGQRTLACLDVVSSRVVGNIANKVGGALARIIRVCRARDVGGVLGAYRAGCALYAVRVDDGAVDLGTVTIKVGVDVGEGGGVFRRFVGVDRGDRPIADDVLLPK